MATTVDAGFDTFHTRLTPSATESNAAKNHRASIESCLKNNFSITSFFRTGSFGNGTSIRGYSDVDYFAGIPRANLKQDSARTLGEVRDALALRFPNTGVRVCSPAVLVPFGTDASESTEVVPADFISQDTHGYRHYEIANGSGGWMSASPDAHNAYVAYQDGRLYNKVKPLVRFIKAWKFFRNAPIRSFYLELFVANYASSEKAIIYAMDVANILQALWNSQLGAINDPMGISGSISACETYMQRNDALPRLQTALERALYARDAERKGNIRDAFYWWNQLFDGNFPAYG